MIIEEESKNTVEELQDVMEEAVARMHEEEMELEDVRAQLSDARAELEVLHAGIAGSGKSVEAVLQRLEEATQMALELRNELATLHPHRLELSPAERHRLMGSGMKRFGFIAKAAEMMRVSTEFVPPFLDSQKMAETIEQLEAVRNLDAILQQAVRLNGDALLLLGDNAYRMARMYYGSVREAASRRIQGAAELFHILQGFFRRKRQAAKEPTEKETISHLKGLMHNQREGEIIVKNDGDRIVSGKQTVMDDTRKI